MSTSRLAAAGAAAVVRLSTAGVASAATAVVSKEVVSMRKVGRIWALVR